MLLKLLTAPLTAPVSGFTFILQQLQEMAERELLDEDRIREEFLLLQLRLEEGAITEEEYVEQEAEILARLRQARELRQGGPSGGQGPIVWGAGASSQVSVGEGHPAETEGQERT